MKEYMQRLGELKEEQNNRCDICSCEMEKTYPDVDMDAGIMFSLLCLDCYSVIGSLAWDRKNLKKVDKYLKFRDSIYNDITHLATHNDKE